MQLRPLAHTGVKVSPLCLGTMMFGARGETDHDRSVEIIHRALDAGINFHRHRRRLFAGPAEEIVGKAL
ncbi:MAG: aldo/keto reductase, partial [Actinomycetota bacterium]|nr:aldo/keto reductase [Actinomycetota bacterium]